MPIRYNYRKVCEQKKKRIEKKKNHCEQDIDTDNAFWARYMAKKRESTYYKDDEERRRCCYSPDDVYHN